MNWMLVLVMVTNHGTIAKEIDVYQTMNDCFKARQQLVLSEKNWLLNKQAVCIRTDQM